MFGFKSSSSVPTDSSQPSSHTPTQISTPPSSSSSSSSSSSPSSMRRWVWTPFGFGEVIHGTKRDRGEKGSSSLVSPSPVQPVTNTSANTDESSASLDSASASASVASSDNNVPLVPSPPPPASPATSRRQFISLLQESSTKSASSSNPSPATSQLPVYPPISTANIPPSVMDDHVTVHMLPHYSLPSASAQLSVSAASSAKPIPTLPTILNTIESNVHSTIRVRIRTFFPYSTLLKPAASSSLSSSVSPKDASRSSSLSSALNKEIRARKEKMDSAAAAAASGGAAPEKEIEKESGSKSESDSKESEKADEKAPSKVLKSGPIPDVCEFEIGVHESLQSLINKIVGFYSDYGVDLDGHSIRLVSNGREISRSSLPEVDPAHITQQLLSIAAASEKLQAATGGDAKSNDAQRKSKKDGKGSSAASAAAAALAAKLPSSLLPPPAVLAAIRDSLWLKFNPTADQWLKANSSNGVGASTGTSAAAGTSSATGNIASVPPTTGKSAMGPISQTDRDRFYRAHTMIAESGMTVSVAPSSSSPASNALPVFPLLLVYDELSRFVLDSNCGSELQLTSDLLGATTSNDSKWLSVRSNIPFTSGRHMWKVKFDRCASGNAFVGVCTSRMKMNNYIGSTNESWGYYGCSNVYRSGSSSSFGVGYRTGDIVTVKLDMDKKTLSFDKNDQSLGCAFTDISESVYPAFSLYSRNDQLTIIDFGTF